MKNHFVALFGLLPMIAAATDEPSLAFSEQKIGLPPLSLAEMGKPGSPVLARETRAWPHGQSLPAPSAKKFVSNMPILPAISDVDPKMIKIPDSSIDYKLIVKTPEVEPAKKPNQPPATPRDQTRGTWP